MTSVTTPLEETVSGLREAAEKVTEAVEAHWGERCPDFDADCACCQAWAELDAFQAQAARIAELERVIAWANNSLFGSHGFFLSKNGGHDDEHHLDRQIEALKEHLRKERDRSIALEAERDMLREKSISNARERNAAERDLAAAVEALIECEDYFDNRADADCDQDGFIPNKEMVLLASVRGVLAKLKGTAK